MMAVENLIIRQAVDGDMVVIKQVVKEAFYRPGKDGEFSEWELVDRIRFGDGAWFSTSPIVWNYSGSRSPGKPLCESPVS